MAAQKALSICTVLLALLAATPAQAVGGGSAGGNDWRYFVSGRAPRRAPAPRPRRATPLRSQR